MIANAQSQGVSAEPAPEIDAAFHCAAVLSPVRRDPWSATLAALRSFSSPPDQHRVVPDPFARGSCKPAQHRQRGGADIRTFTVTVLEQLSNSLVALSWRDPTLCNYEEQMWSPALARNPGRCALSGLHIRKGDAIYKPVTRGKTAPLNRDAMILASALPKVRDDQQATSLVR